MVIWLWMDYHAIQQFDLDVLPLEEEERIPPHQLLHLDRFRLERCQVLADIIRVSSYRRDDQSGRTTIL